MTEIHSVILIVKSYFETQGVVGCFVPGNLLYFYWRLKVPYFVSASEPSYSCRLDILFWIQKWLHPLIIRTLRFVKVYDVKSVFYILAGVLDSKVKPLGHEYVECVVVWTKFKIVNVFTNLRNFSQISTFKAWFKQQSWVRWPWQRVYLP